MSTPAKPIIHFVVARDRHGVIGDGTQMLWSLRDDLAYFKRTTMGAPIVMGRRTWESIGRALPGRRNIVLTRQRDFTAGGAEVFHAPEDVLQAVQDEADVHIIGGGEIYRLFLDDVDMLHLTEVHAAVDGKVTFPEIDLSDWTLVFSESYPADARNQYAFDIREYRRAHEAKP